MSKVMANLNYKPGLIPWIALLILLFMMVNAMDMIVDHITLLHLDVLELQMDIDDEEEEFMPEYEPGEVPERLRIAATRFSEEKLAL